MKMKMKMKMKRYSSIVLSVLVTGIVVLGSVFLSSNRSYALRQYMERKMEIPSADVNKLSGNMAMTVGKVTFGILDESIDVAEVLLWDIKGNFSLGDFTIWNPAEALRITIDAETGKMDSNLIDHDGDDLTTSTTHVPQIVSGSNAHSSTSRPTMTLFTDAARPVNLNAQFLRSPKIKQSSASVTLPVTLHSLSLHAVEGEFVVNGSDVKEATMSFSDGGRIVDSDAIVIRPSATSERAVIKFGLDIEFTNDYLEPHIEKSKLEGANWRFALGKIVFTITYGTS